MKKQFIFFSLLLLSFADLYAVHPIVRNFSKKLSNAGTQNWDVVQSKNNWMYFANNKGMLEFDGLHWKIYPIKNGTNVRSLLYDNQTDYIYAGAYKEFGYYKRNEIGVLDYHSLSASLKEREGNFAEVWAIHKLDGRHFFQSDYCVFRAENNRIKRFSFDDKINRSSVVNGKLIISCYNRGVSWFNGTRFEPFPNSEILKNKKVCAILPFLNGQILFVTDFHGLFIFNGKCMSPFVTDMDAFLKKNQVFCATIKNHQLALGTVQNGLVVKNLVSNETIFSNNETGLQNNTVLSISFDRLNNLWLGLDNGIDYVIVNSPICDLIGNSKLVGAGYSSLIYNNNLFLGTNQGLYKMDYPIRTTFHQNHIQSIDKIKGQVWNLITIDNSLFCSSDQGLFIITKNEFRQIDSLRGVWMVKPILSRPGYLMGATYNGFFILRKVFGRWEFSNFLKGCRETSNSFCEDSTGDIWFSHWTNGIYRQTLSKDLKSISSIKFYGVSNGLPSAKNNTVFIYQHQVLFSTEKGLYQYNSKLDRIEKSATLDKSLCTPLQPMKLFVSPSNDFWSVNNSNISVAFNRGAKQRTVEQSSFYLLKDKVMAGFEHISFLNDRSILVGTEDGFSLVDTTQLFRKEGLFAISIQNVCITNKRDSLINRLVGHPETKNAPVFDSENNSIRFEFVGTEYRCEKTILYSYLLENLDVKWSEFTNINTKEFTNLPAGSYVFRVRAKNLFNSQIVETSYCFSVLPPWYKSTTAIIIYVLLFVMAIYVLFWYIKFRVDKAAHEMEAKKELEMKEQEKLFLLEKREKEQEIISLKNQQLQYKLRHKSQDLAGSTMNLIRKNEILMKINGNLSKIEADMTEQSDTTIITKRIRHMQDEIKKNIEYDNNWIKFQENFDLVYEDYLKRLSDRFPVLTLNDKKLCAYLKMDLSSKDIAPLLNTTFQSVEMSRHRLRKKMELNREVNLTDFLQNF